MSLTPEQEAKVLQIIAAFEDGKRLGDLPKAAGSNPFDLVVEVLDRDGESKQAGLAAMLPYVEEQCAYGIEWDTAVSSPLCTRIGNTSLHKSLPIQSRMRGCLLSDGGTVVEYLNPTNWRAHALDGSRGQVMVEIPAHWRRFEAVGTVRRIWLSEYPLPGYHFVPLSYVSAYEAALERSSGKLCSVANMGEDYRGGNNQKEWDGTHRSLLGRPVTVQSRTAFRTAARKRGAEWNEYVYDVHKTIFWLYYVEYANRNCQTAFTAQKDAGGFPQGGLGNGVTNWNGTAWSSFNGYHPFVPCGYTDEYGNGTGVKDYKITNEDGSDLFTVSVPRYRGIENPFGHVWKWTDGVNVEISSEAEGGTSKVYVCSDPSKFSDSGYDGYSLRGLEARNEGYVNELIFGEYGDIMPSKAGGSSTAHWCDYHYTNIPGSGKALRGVLFGGFAYNGASAGFAYAHSYYVPSHTSAYFGSRLCFIPKSA